MKKIEEMIYESFGTTYAPSSQRVAAIQEFKDYIEICELLEDLTEFHKSIEPFFNLYPGVKTVSFKIIDISTFSFMKFFDEESDEKKVEVDKMVVSFRSLATNSKSIMTSWIKLDGIEIERGNIKYTLAQSASINMLEVFNKIENFEKNKLDSTIATNNKKPKKMKV